MRIYPSKHVVAETERPKFLDIPLAHIEKNYIPTKIVAEPSPEMTHAETEYIAPYQQFDDNNALIFTDDGKISKTKLVSKDGKYVYFPEDAKEFAPVSFHYTVSARRNTSIKSNRNYDFKVGVYQQKEAKNFAQKLLGIFGDAPYRGICPSNIYVNGGRTDVDEMLSEDGKDLDFLFVQGSSTEFLKDLSGPIPYDTLFESDANIWLTLTDAGCQKWFGMFGDQPSSCQVRKLVMGERRIRYATVREDNAYSITANGENCGWYAISGSVMKMFDKAQFDYLMPTKFDELTPAFILRKRTGNFVVVSNEKLFEHLDVFSPYIYDVMQKLYTRSQFRTKARSLWITDEPVDYMGSLDVPFRHSQPEAVLDRVIHEDNPTEDEYKLSRVHTDNDNVVFDHVSEDGRICFRKLSRTDPECQQGDTTVFTYKHTILSFKEQKNKLVESGIKIGTSIQDNRCYVTVYPFASSKFRLLNFESPTFELPDCEKRYVVRALPINTDGISTIDVVPEEENTSEAAVILATVRIECEGRPKAYDIRQLGGGLPATLTDYDMIDIGNMKGRPYRVGTGAVIRLPKAYEKYDERIRKAVESYKVAADQFYIIYRDE